VQPDFVGRYEVKRENCRRARRTSDENENLRTTVNRRIDPQDRCLEGRDSQK
jgi:hypothetical protein